MHQYEMKSVNLYIKLENIAQIAPLIRSAIFDIVLLRYE